MKDRFIHEKPWESTDWYDIVRQKVNRGEMFWNGCTSERDIQRRCAYVDELFDAIAEEGYKSQEDLSSGGAGHPPSEVAIGIGRNGELVYMGGRHRLAIAKILEIESIPARINLRHEDWIDELSKYCDGDKAIAVNDIESKYLDIGHE